MIKLDGTTLTISDVISVARSDNSVELSAKARAQIEKSHQNLEAILSNGRPVYGINTGFGIFSDKRIKPDETNLLNRNLILSHAVGTGTQLDPEIVKAAMLVRANALSKGYSGVRVEIVEILLKMLEKGVIPVIPSQGSLGSSGDLCQLSHLALVFSTDNNDLIDQSGTAHYHGQVLPGKIAMEKAGIKRIKLSAKEGLAINNGATFSTAIAALCNFDARYLLKIANLALCLSLEALLGCIDAFRPEIHNARNHPGQKVIAKEVMQFIEGSELINLSNRVQDAYSLRCAPQVHGSILETIEFVDGIINREINAATDNPLIFDQETVLSGGNFHGEPVGLAMDYLGIAMTELGAISERRSFRMLDGNLSDGLPAMLVDEGEQAGLNSGLMMPQYTAASLVLENQTLATPDSIHSLPTSGNQEDHNANSMTAARHTRQIISNTEHVLAVELATACRAIDLRLKQTHKELGKGTQKAYDLVRKQIPYHASDTLWYPQIEKIKSMVHEHQLEI